MEPQQGFPSSCGTLDFGSRAVERQRATARQVEGVDISYSVGGFETLASQHLSRSSRQQVLTSSSMQSPSLRKCER